MAETTAARPSQPSRSEMKPASNRAHVPGSKPETRPTRVIAVANQKGGVGKSTTAVSLGAALAELGRRVLVVDLDPQGNASTGLGIRHEARAVTVYDVLADEAPIEQAIVETPLAGLYAIPSTIDLAGAEIELVSQFSRELKLRKAMEPLKDSGFDFVLLDCPPSLGLLTVNALAAAEELIVPIQCEYYALEGLGQLIKNVRLVQQNVNPGLRLTGIVMTMYDPRTKLSEQVVEEVRKYFGDRVYDTIIPRTVRLSEAPGFGLPITAYDPRSRGATSYRDLAHEVVEKKPSDRAIPAMDHLPAVVMAPPEPQVMTAPHPLRRPSGGDDRGVDEGELSPDQVEIEEETIGGDPLVEEGIEGSATAQSAVSPVSSPTGDRGSRDGEGADPEVSAPSRVGERPAQATKPADVVIDSNEDEDRADEGRTADRAGEGPPKHRWSLFRRGGQ